MKFPFHIPCLWLLLFAITLSSCTWFDKRVEFDIEAGIASKTLKTFAVQAGIDILFNEQDLNEVQTPKVSGKMTIETALKRMVEPSGLVFNHDKETHAIAVFYPEET